MNVNTQYLTTAELERMRGFGNLKRFVEVMDELSLKSPGALPLQLVEITEDGREVLLDKGALVNMREVSSS